MFSLNSDTNNTRSMFTNLKLFNGLLGEEIFSHLNTNVNQKLISHPNTNVNQKLFSHPNTKVNQKQSKAPLILRLQISSLKKNFKLQNKNFWRNLKCSNKLKYFLSHKSQFWLKVMNSKNSNRSWELISKMEFRSRISRR